MVSAAQLVGAERICSIPFSTN